MAIHQHAALEGTVYFWFASNDTSGSGNDGASAAADVRLAGAAASAAPVLSPTPSLLTDAGYPAGCYEVAVAATTGNGFSAGSTYGVFCTLAVDSQNPVGFVGSFTLDPILANVTEISDDATAAANAESFFDGTGYAGTGNTIPTVTSVTNQVTANTTSWNGTAVATPDTAGYPVVTIKDGTGQGEIALTSGAIDNVTLAATTTDVTNGVTVATNNDKTGYSIADATSDGVIADAVWNAATATYGVAGSYGLLVETNLDAAISSRSSHAAADIWSVGTRTITGGTIDTNNDKTGYSIADTTSDAVIADAVWNALTSGYGGVGSYGEQVESLDTSNLDAAITTRSSHSAADVWAVGTRTITGGTIDTNNDKTGYSIADATSDAVIADAVWNALTAGYGTAGTYGEHVEGLDTGAVTVSGTVSADVVSISGDGPAADNMELFFDGTGYDAANSTVGNVTLVATTTAIGATGLTAINAEVADVMTVDTISAITQQAPPNTPTFEEAIIYLYSALTEKVVVDVSGSPDYKEFYTTGGSVAWKKEVTDGSSIYTEAAGATGP